MSFINQLNLIVFLALFISCTCEKKEAVIPEDSCESVTYTKDIRPLIITKCAVSGCHVTGFSMGNFLSYDSLRLKVDNGSLKLRVLTTTSMPPLNPLSETERNKISCWLETGAMNN